MILDDLVKDSSEANSDTVCRGIIEWLQHVCFTRLTPNGRVLAIATRWSERDPIGWILQQHGWTMLHLPALAESAKDPLRREIGEELWPSHYPVEALEAIRADVGPRVFQCLYQGNASASQGTIFKRDWFRHYQHLPENFTKVIQSWDTAFKVGQANDYSVCATIGQTQNGFYLLSLYREKVEFPESKRKVEELAGAWKPSEIYVEDKASGQSLIQELKLATSYPVIPVKVDKDKETRASAVTGYFEAGKVLFPQLETAKWVADLEDELASFPGGLHDDCVDAISQALNRMRDAGGVLGLLILIKDLAMGKRKPVTTTEERLQQTVLTNFEQQKTPAAKLLCPVCEKADMKQPLFPLSGNLHCNQCRNDFDNSLAMLEKAKDFILGQNCCPEAIRKFALDGQPYVQHGGLKCNGCGKEARPSSEPTNGMTPEQYRQYRLNRWRGMGQYALRSGPAKFPWSSSGRF